ncbi:DUF2642 domain-containing protein [Heyndrickxia sp. FSL W8-0423]|uniref:DUF2642 domain-containing protein n=1 Tax=Heyndrickxia sp. FSL W8-0423 TaxID=2921601 RepID=UPI0030F82E96
MNGMKSFINSEIELEISGKTILSGILIDVGLDIIVIFDGTRYLYIPLLHVHQMKERALKEIESEPPETFLLFNETEPISYRKTLNHAKGQFIELFVTGNRSIHGYITSVLNDYLVFYSPVYKTIFISMQHLKWFTPYSHQLTPYTLGNKELPIVPASIPLARSFEEQLKKYEGQLVVLDLGDNPEKIGLLKNVSNNMIELILANGQAVIWKFGHLKTVHLP